MAQGNLPILPPQLLARPHLDGAGHEVGSVEHGAAVGAALDGPPRIPLAIEALGQLVDHAQPPGIGVHEGQGAAAQ